MADVKISALTAASSALDADEVPVNETGTTKKVTVTQLRTLGTASSVMGADVTCTSSNTNYDLVSISLDAGTYLLTGIASFLGAGVGSVGVKLWDGTTVYASTAELVNGNGFHAVLNLSAIVVLAGTTTVKLTARNDSASHVVKYSESFGGETVGSRTRIDAVRIA